MAEDTLQLETWWSDHAIVSLVLPQAARPARAAGHRPRNNSTLCDGPTEMTPAEIGTLILQEASNFGHAPTYQDTLPR
eukprot:2031078-Pyramimonas_sp.AAC.1